MKLVGLHRVGSLCTRLGQPKRAFILLAMACSLNSTKGEGLPDLDRRLHQSTTQSEERQRGVAHLRELAPDVQVEFDSTSGSPKWIASKSGFLSQANGVGNAISPNAHRGIDREDRHKPVK